MHLSFFVLLLIALCIVVVSLSVFFRAALLTEKFAKGEGEKNLKIMRIIRLLAVCAISVSCIAVGLHLPQTKYVRYLTGKYYFAKFTESQSLKAADKAFSLWQRSANKQAFEEVFEKIPQNSRVWKSFIERSSRLYYQKGELDSYVQYLLDLEAKLMHPIGKSSIYFQLGSVYQAIDPIKAENYFKTVISLQSDREDVDRARGNIHEIHNLNLGQYSPNFHLSTLDNKRISLQDLQGSIVLLDFWSIHCGGCIDEIPTLKDIYSFTKSKDFAMVGISLDHGEAVVKYIKEKNLSWQHVIVNQELSSEILDSFNIQYIPSTYVLDRNGRIRHKNLRGEKLKEAIFNLLE